MEDLKWMQEAINEALAAKAEANLPFAAVVVKDGQMIGKSHSREHTLSDVTAHAEIEAVSQANRAHGLDLTGCTIYCIGEPCTMCASAILQAKISRIVIATTRDELEQIMRPRKIRLQQLADDSAYKPEVVAGILKAEVLDLFSDIHLR